MNEEPDVIDNGNLLWNLHTIKIKSPLIANLWYGTVIKK